MVVLRIKEYGNGEVALEYRTTRKERSIDIPGGKVDMISYHYSKLGTFYKGSSILEVIDIDAGYDLIKTLSEMGENNITDFIIEIAANPNEYLETRIAGVIRLFRLTPEDVLLVRPNFDYLRECC